MEKFSISKRSELVSLAASSSAIGLLGLKSHRPSIQLPIIGGPGMEGISGCEYFLGLIVGFSNAPAPITTGMFGWLEEGVRMGNVKLIAPSRNGLPDADIRCFRGASVDPNPVSGKKAFLPRQQHFLPRNHFLTTEPFLCKVSAGKFLGEFSFGRFPNRPVLLFQLASDEVVGFP